MSKGTVLVIDDEKDLIELVRYNLRSEGFEVLAARDGESGVREALDRRPDLVLIDLMLPGIDGLEVCQRLRSDERTCRIPLIMLTAKSSEADRVVGLELGADDYVTKPFSPRELAARVKAVLRRAGGQQELPEIIRRGGLEIDMARHEVSCGGEKVELTATEFRLLHLLAGRPGRVFSRGELIDGALGRDVAVLDRTIDVHVVALRKKLGKCGGWIETIRGFGYRFREDEPSIPD
jgi:two-component system phosphate regulon response regulator PhoB